MAPLLNPARLWLRDVLLSVGPVALLTLALAWLAYEWLAPNPPSRVVLATGPAQSAYDRFGQQYAQALRQHGIEVTLRPTGGSADNLALLRRGEVDLGFVQGGSPPLQDTDAEHLQSLGQLFVEPLWLFYREDAALRRQPSGRLATLPELAGWRVNVDTDGSGVPQLFLRLLEANGVGPEQLQLSRLPQTPATVAFLDGALEALVFVSAPESAMVQMLLQTPGVRLMHFAQAQAYARRFGFLSPEVLPQGVVDLAGNRPQQDHQLVATTTSLLARDGTHPALLQLLAQSAIALHGQPGWFQTSREFPRAQHDGLPVSDEIDRALRNGTPWLQRYLPFWLANLVERMWLALGLILALALPLSRVVPPLVALRIRSRVFRWYPELRQVETLAEQGLVPVADLMARLDALEAQAEQVKLPLAYTEELYTLRHHIDLVRRKLQRLT